MYLTFKNIRLACVIIFCFSILSSNLLALDLFKERYIIDNRNSDIYRTKGYLKKCLESKSHNFEDRKSIVKRMILIYVNTLLDNIISHNKDILDKFGRSPDQFCVDIGDIGVSSFADMGEGLILIDLNRVYVTLELDGLIYDSYVVANLAHELAHELLQHFLKSYDKELEIYNASFKDKYKDINEYNLTLVDYSFYFTTRDYPDPDEVLTIEKNAREGILPDNPLHRRIAEQILGLGNYSYSDSEYKRARDNVKKLNEEFNEWKKFFPKHDDYIKMRKEGEIEADNLGLKLYLNTGFKADDFGKHYISNRYYYNNPDYYPSIPDIFKTISQGDNYITEGERARQEGRFNEFMESIKYVDSNKEHPSDFWLYWNARTQIETAHIDINRGIRDNLYIRLDLSKSEILLVLKMFFSDKDNLSENINGKIDPRYYIIDHLFNPNTTLSYTLEFIPYNRDDIGRVLDDNTILLRFNDVFQIASIINQSQYPNCTLFFSTFGINPYEKFYTSIMKAFLPR